MFGTGMTRNFVPGVGTGPGWAETIPQAREFFIAAYTIPSR